MDNPTSSSSSSRGLARALAVAASVPVGLALGLLAFFMLPAGSPLLLLSLLVPAVVVGAVVDRTGGGSRSARPDPRPAGAREARGPVVLVLLVLVLGVGTWVAVQVAGVLLGVIPFLMPPDEPHPLVDVWSLAAVLLGVVSVPAWWWLLARTGARRAQDPQRH